MSNHYAVSRIEALENALFTPQKLYALIESVTSEQQEKILSENGYSVGKGIDEKISENRRESLEFICESCSSGELKTFFLLKNDFTAIKRILKLILLELPYKEVEQGNVSVGEIESKILKNMIVNIEPLSEKLVEGVVLDCFDAFQKHFGSIIDIRVDRGYYEMVELLARDSHLPLFQEYAKREIFYRNIKMLYRVRREESLKKVCEYGWIEGGNFSSREWQKFIEYDDSKLEKIFESALMHIKESESLMKQGKFESFERAIEREWREKVKNSKLNSSSDEKILAHYFIKEFEYTTLKRIIKGKQMGVSSERLIESVRGEYV